MSTDLTTYVTAEDYLARERTATETKCEWIDGEIREMVGAKHAHNVVNINLVRLISTAVLNRPWITYGGDMKVGIPDGPYYYPDLAVTPDPPEFEDGLEDIVLNPAVVVEVLSPSTESDDRGRKLDDYRRIPTLRHYLLVDQTEPRIDHYRLGDDGWRLEIVTRLDGAVSLPTIDVELKVVDVYDRVVSKHDV